MIARLITKQQIARIVSGNLRDAIIQHGPITERRIGSAAKRIAGALHAELVIAGAAEPNRKTRARRMVSKSPAPAIDEDDAGRDLR